MTLNCSVENCIHNNCGTCYAGKITISGSHASNSSNTHCSTFTQGKDNLNNISSNLFTTSNDITCKALSCYYNDESTCTADGINVCGDKANCSTFVSK